MRIFIIILILLALAVIASAVFFRSVDMAAEDWHIDPAEMPLHSAPNFDLRVGENAPVIPGLPADVATRLDAIATGEGARVVGGSLEEGHITYVLRSRIMGFPDAVSVRFHAEGEGTRIDILSRSRFGHSDLGVNAARVERWIAALGQ